MIDEGVVKYSLEFTESEAIESKQIQEIESLREDLFTLGLIGAYAKNGIGYGNISQKFEDSDFEFLITGTQTGDIENLEPKHYSIVTKIDFEKFTTYASGVTRPSSEAITHGAIYQISPKIKAVIHIHSEKLWNFMLKNGYLSTNDVPYGSPEMVKDINEIYRVVDALANPLFVMKGHFEGVFLFGETLSEAKKTLYKLLNTILRS